MSQVTAMDTGGAVLLQEIVAFLDTLGLRPGVQVVVKEKHPFDGPLVLRVDGKDRTLGAPVANQVYVQKSA